VSQICHNSTALPANFLQQKAAQLEAAAAAAAAAAAGLDGSDIGSVRLVPKWRVPAWL
jgi:hypothetical protein